MNLSSARQLALNLMSDHDLIAKGWQFEWSRAIHQFGLCSYRHKTITLSRKLVECNEEPAVKDTILHEIAHALCGPGTNHGPIWKLKAQQIGAKPQACYSSKDINVPETAYHGVCRDCGVKVPRVKRPHRSTLLSAYHPKCRYRAKQGKIDWYCHGVRMHGLIESIPAPGVFEHHEYLPAAAHNPAPLVKQELTQSDITEMWERLNKIKV